MPSLQPIGEGSKALAAKAVVSKTLAAIGEGTRTLAALAERAWSQTISGGTYTVDPTGDPTFPGSATLPGSSTYPGTWATGLFPTFYPSSQTIVTTDAPRLEAEAEGSLALTPLSEA